MSISSAIFAWKSQPLVLVLLVCGATALPLLAHSDIERSAPPTAGHPASPELVVAVTDNVEEKILGEVRTLQPALRLVVKRFDDREQARAALLRGNADVGAFETLPSLAGLADEQARKFTTGATTVTLPYSFYTRTHGPGDRLEDGARIAFAREDEARALWLLHNADLLQLRDDARPNAKLGDVARNPRRFELAFVDTSALDDELTRAAIVGIDYERAGSLGLSPRRHAWLMEDGYSAFSHVLTARADDERALALLASAYRTKPIQRFVLTEFEDSVRRSW